MSIRGWERSTLLAAVSAAAVLGLTACGPTSEPTGTTESSASSSPSAEASPETTADETDGGSSSQAVPSPSETSSSAPETDAAPEDSAEPEAEADAAAGPDKGDNDPALCDAADLNGKIEDIPGGATAGSVYRGLVLTNSSGEECILKGFPGVSFVNDGGNQIGAAATRNSAEPSESIELLPGESAMATLKQTNAQNYGPQCEQTEAAGVRVYPPSAYDSLIVGQDITACANDAISLMTITAFQPQ